MSVDVLERGTPPAKPAGLHIEKVDGVASLRVVELASLDRVKASLAPWPTASLARRILDTEFRADD